MSSLRRVSAVVGKDLQAFGRDRFFLLVTVLGLVFYVLVLYLLPTSADEPIRLGVVGGDLPVPAAGMPAPAEGLTVVRFADREALRRAVAGEAGAEGRGVAAGVVLPEDFVAEVAAGRRATVEVLAAAALPEEVRTAVEDLVREVAWLLAGEPLPVRLDHHQLIVGAGAAAGPISLREQMRPLFAFLVLLVESFALATLVASELQQRTATALLVTPLRVSELLGAKAVVGTALAFAEAGLLLALTGGLAAAPGPLLLAVLLGAVLVTGVGLVAGSLGRDLLGIIGWGMLFIVPLAIPAFSVLFPGSAAAWVQALPSHGFVAALVGLTARGQSLAAVAGDLAALAAWSAAALAVGTWTLRYRVAHL